MILLTLRHNGEKVLIPIEAVRMIWVDGEGSSVCLDVPGQWKTTVEEPPAAIASLIKMARIARRHAAGPGYSREA